MERLHARYPFFESSREAVEAADVDLAELIVDGDGLVVERGLDRAETALSEGTVGDRHRSPRVELLSYPVARVLISLLDEPMAVDAYARAEAATARRRFQADLPEPGALEPELGEDGPTLTVDRLLAEFDLAEEIEGRDPFELDVTTYLQLARGLEGEGWALVDRSLTEGRVPVDRAELYALLEEAAARQVNEGLPLAVPEPIADGLTAEVGELESLLSEADLPEGFDRVDPSAFPPCVGALLERARDGESLPAQSQFALVGFLGAAGMDADALVDLAGGGLDRETVEYQLAHVRGERGLEYAPPSCATMDAYGDCVNRDERCDRINHPMTYYGRALEDVEGD